jgi:protein gp37
MKANGCCSVRTDMGETTGIAWTDHTWNPWMGCQKVSPGCTNCYAEALVTTRMRLPVWGPAASTERKRTSAATWKNLGTWDRAAARDGVRRRVFVSSLADVFEDHPALAPWRAEALDLLANVKHMDVQLLTKRPQNILSMVPSAWRAAWPRHIWVGTTVEDQERAERRVAWLNMVPAAVRFLSCEPLLGPLDLTNGPSNRWSVPTRVVGGKPAEWSDPGEKFIPVDWVIVGGESGAGARPFDLAWARSIVQQCAESGVPAFVKQMGDHAVALDRRGALSRLSYLAHHGAAPSEWPESLRVQQFPEVTP